MKKIKQLANNAFVRPDRTEVLSESLQEAERRIDQIKLTCDSLAKKVNDCLQGRGKEKDVDKLDKRIRKVPEFILGSAMIQHGKNLGDGSIMGEVLSESGQIEMKLGQAVVEYEIKIEECILKPLQQLTDHDLPQIYKLKRNLAKHTSEMDMAKAKLQQANRHSTVNVGHQIGQGTKADSIRDEYEEAFGKVEQCRDNLAAEMYSLIARESELSKLVLDFLTYQKDYHSSVFSILSELISNVEACMASSTHKPCYGQDLQSHLTSSSRSIAYPIELCVCGLLETGIEEEGLFRIAGSTSKVKKLKSAVDAGLLDLDGLLEEFCDPHVIANALKSYFREMPEPLLTFSLYNDWMNAIRIQDATQKLEALWFVVKRLPPQNLENLRYLVKFLKELSEHQDVNKMSPANIAIVIAPNLLWTPQQSQGQGQGGGDPTSDPFSGDNTQMGLNMTMTHLYSSVLDQLISNCSYFFPEEIDFFVTYSKPVAVPVLEESKGVSNRPSVLQLSQSQSLTNGDGENSSEEKEKVVKRSCSNSSLDADDIGGSPKDGSPKPILRRKNKPAPTPPSQQNQNQKIPTNKNPLANMKPFSGSYNTGSNTASSGKERESAPISPMVAKEKREAMWIPPSPKETNTNRRKVGEDNKMAPPPVKPPPPQMNIPKLSHSQSDAASSSASSSSPLRYKSSFKEEKEKELKGLSAPPTTQTQTPTPSSSNTTDNIMTTPTTSQSQTYASLPRHFHTENSHHRKTPPVRPPSMFGVPPPAPPTATNKDNDKEKEKTKTTATLKEEVEKRPKSLAIEKKESGSSEEEGNGSNSNQTARPVPAPRSSLQQKEGQGVGESPAVRERPSIMAKPRDLTRRHQGGHGQGQGDGLSHTEESVGSGCASQEKSLDFTEKELITGGKCADNTANGTAKPPRPQPPAPNPKLAKESTDL